MTIAGDDVGVGCGVGGTSWAGGGTSTTEFARFFPRPLPLLPRTPLYKLLKLRFES